MTNLTARQRAHLKSLAHPLKPVVRIGKDGITESVVQSVTEALHTRELLKVKLLESAPTDARAAAAALGDQLTGTAVVQVIGRTIVLFRRHPDRPAIELPR